MARIARLKRARALPEAGPGAGHRGVGAGARPNTACGLLLGGHASRIVIEAETAAAARERAEAAAPLFIGPRHVLGRFATDERSHYLWGG